eukprot:GFKZ01009580.1.p1 GENE.GFKZ01009580.1~~GFKZ01009580.1.p1  ORF type:complete len:241 (-),score=28.45 GFKZ01009580.1:746-1468(-)
MCQHPPIHDSPFHTIDPPSSPETDDSYSIPKRPLARHRDTLIQRTLTLYDWDDTFLPSTYLAAQGVRVEVDDDLPQQLAEDLAQLEAIVIKILEEAMSYGVVKVITNAEEGWVEMSGNRFMPRLTKFLKENDIKIVSARTTYEADIPGSPSGWKTAAFAAEVHESFPNIAQINVLVLGDSLSEREAAHALAHRLPTACIKSVKLVEHPDVTQLQRQIALLHGSFRDLREHYGSFDVNLTC